LPTPEIITPLELFSETIVIIDELLFDKYRVQKKLDQETNHSISKYVEETRKRVEKLSADIG